jgi:hypothetical protein
MCGYLQAARQTVKHKYRCKVQANGSSTAHPGAWAPGAVQMHACARAKLSGSASRLRCNDCAQQHSGDR